MKTSELTGAHLDYWVARAEGIPAEQLEIREVQRPDPRTPNTICVRNVWDVAGLGGRCVERIDYSTNWARAGRLLEKYEFSIYRWKDDTDFWAVEPPPPGGKSHYIDCYADDFVEEACETPLIAICRAVVRAAFGGEVEDLPCA